MSTEFTGRSQFIERSSLLFCYLLIRQCRWKAHSSLTIPFYWIWITKYMTQVYQIYNTFKNITSGELDSLLQMSKNVQLLNNKWSCIVKSNEITLLLAIQRYDNVFAIYIYIYSTTVSNAGVDNLHLNQEYSKMIQNP